MKITVQDEKLRQELAHLSIAASLLEMAALTLQFIALYKKRHSN